MNQIQCIDSAIDVAISENGVQDRANPHAQMCCRTIPGDLVRGQQVSRIRCDKLVFDLRGPNHVTKCLTQNLLEKSGRQTVIATRVPFISTGKILKTAPVELTDQQQPLFSLQAEGPVAPIFQ